MYNIWVLNVKDKYNRKDRHRQTTLFNEVTMLNAEISNYPLTTKGSNVGYVKTSYVCRELGVKEIVSNDQDFDKTLLKRIFL